MQPIDSVRFRSIKDKIMVFVSSRLLECKAERAAVREAILSINHQPVLFEHLGSRPYSARELYLSRLRESQVMVAIYRSGYGYIDSANGMVISGLEDEYRFATSKNIRTLVYVYRDKVDREEKLESLIEDAGNRLTLSFYDKPEQLVSRVRDDLTSLITEACLDSISETSTLDETSAGLLARTEIRSGLLIRRDEIVVQVELALQTYGIASLVGPAGIGKTTLAAQFAADCGARFLRVSGLSPKEIFAVCATAMTQQREATSGSASLESAIREFELAWIESEDLTLVLDECEFIEDIVHIVENFDYPRRNRILFTARHAPSSLHQVEVPPFSRAEALAMLNAFSSSKEWTEPSLSLGSPLLLQSFIAAREQGLQGSDFSNLSGTAGEVLRYLAIAPVPLSASDLIEVFGSSDYSIDSLYADLAKLGRLVDDSPRGLRLMHANLGDDIVRSLQASPQRIAFYANRLTLLFDRQEQPLHSYRVRKNLGDGSEEKYAIAAGREAARLGDLKVGLAIAEQALAFAINQQSRSEAFYLLLALIVPFEMSGRHERALELLSQAEVLARELGLNAVEELEETKITLKARSGLSAGDVEAALSLYRSYGERGREWDQARLGLELSAIYINSKQFDEAIEISRRVLEGFAKAGDEFGVECAQRNLAVSLAATKDGEAESEAMIRLISDRSISEQDNRRQRAWYCNILTRRYRESGRYSDARAVAQEAIDIARELGDESLRALNLVNLGNVERDDDVPTLAKTAYEEAATAARSCGRLDIDADASRLIAGLFNDFEELGAPAHRFETAMHYAQYSVGLLKGTVYQSAAASAYVELSDALLNMNRTESAAIAIFRGAKCYLTDHNDDMAGRCLARAVRELLPDNPETYLRQLFEFSDLNQSASAADVENELLDTVELVIKAAPRNALILVLGRHLAALIEELPAPSRSAASLKIVKATMVEALLPEPWQALYAGLVFTSLGARAPSFYHQQIANSITTLVPDVNCRQDGGSWLWTVVLELGVRVVVSIAPMDDSTDVAIACSALAMFFKAFEEDVRSEVLGSNPVVEEVAFNVGRYDLLPDDVREIASEQFDLGGLLDSQDCVASRATSFEYATPTMVFLSKQFADRAKIWGDEGQLQALFAFSLVELVVQLQRGEVEMDAIRPKVVSLVGKTLASGGKLSAPNPDSAE